MRPSQPQKEHVQNRGEIARSLSIVLLANLLEDSFTSLTIGNGEDHFHISKEFSDAFPKDFGIDLFQIVPIVQVRSGRFQRVGWGEFVNPNKISL
jgi:hypothetical protein